jgi:hypothetical protein
LSPVKARAGLALLTAALVVGGCAPEPVTLPEPPRAAETAALVATYQMPTATLDPSGIVQIMNDAQARLTDLHLDWLPDLVSNLLVAVGNRLSDGGISKDPASTPDPTRAQVTAFLQVHRICPGWDDPVGPPDEAQNGALDATAIVDTGRLNPEVWGTATACRVRVPPAGSTSALSVVTPPVVNAILDGTLIIYSLGPLPRTVDEAQFLLSFDGAVTVGDQTKTLSFDFQIVNRSVEFRVPVGNGDAIVTVGATLGIRGANASYSCDLATQTCSAP